MTKHPGQMASLAGSTKLVGRSSRMKFC
uniref:Uncharacterized protein n=1 Tax=Arundo donax TaxID=35708 RepID=A0A0A9AAL5_ARUDO